MIKEQQNSPKSPKTALNGGKQASCDVVVVGGGMAGMTFAVALESAGITVTVLEQLDPAGFADAGFDGRVSALSLGSRQVLETIGLWEAMSQDAAPILDIDVTDGGTPAFLHFDHKELSPDSNAQPMGHIVENRVIRRAQMEKLPKLTGLKFMAPAVVKNIEREKTGARVSLEDGTVITARLVVAADGRASRLRKDAKINATSWHYDQSAIVTTVIHDQPHQGMAVEKFLAPGPFAVLPMTDDADGHHRSSIVWSDRSDLVPAFLKLNESDFNGELARRFGDHLGCVCATGPRWSYPLGLSLAETYIADRLALIGDAAHAIHPIAGQGLNLGIRDAAALAEVVVDASRLGLDIGMKTVLEDYQHWRGFDAVALAGATDILNRLFSTNNAPLRFFRGVGIDVVNAIGPVRRLFMREAMGITGDLPRLVRGDVL
jgi:2-octaprenyl-6-methoxyphenol hydroxylase